MDYTIASGTTAVGSGDTAPATGTPGEFTNGNPSTSTPATVLPGYQMNALVQEIRNAIVAAGLTPSKSDNTQLAAAISALVRSPASSYAVDTGTANNYVVALSPALTAYVDGIKVRFKAGHANTGASTLNAGPSALPILGTGGTTLGSGVIVAGQDYEVIYSSAASSWLLLAQTGGQLVVPTATISGAAVNLAQLNAVSQGGTKTLGAAVATTSGTAVTFSGIPSWAKRISVEINASNNGSSLLVQLGVGGVVATTGYASTGIGVSGSNTTQAQSSTAGMIIFGGAFTGRMVIDLLGSNTWISSHAGFLDTANGRFGGGAVTLGGVLDTLRITSPSGTSAFTAGTINIMWE